MVGPQQQEGLLRLSYYEDPKGNFGDDLNEWLWDRAAPGFVNDDPSCHLIGIGTLLGSWFEKALPAQALKVVIGTGSGGKGALVDLSNNWKLYGVRGPLTAAYYRLAPNLITADPAVLINEFSELFQTTGRDGVGFMPHVWSAREWDWQTHCQRLGITYIDPHADSLKTISSIGKLNKVITEAMHGAIVADALRVPWVAVSISRRFDAVKWADWAGALSVDVKFHQILELRRSPPAFSYSSFKRAVKAMGTLAGKQFDTLSLPRSTRFEQRVAITELRRLVTHAPGQLSSDEDLRSAIARVKNALDRARSDQARGFLR
ncbi:polysaccharide pyruvyl transferase family protein [Sphingomonas xinjiangensis]|uniref:Succinoglycan biosynthesis protein ExoV n=1 Tax=Sphingomonas xinjiangensis TaxID=643568 RepID=A0A840YFD0_9SPHN|nr:polysaccharide pyruvyl transferase family protein [Sphingomonas xinjiangensis]MBB5712157.1 succinoglycan biosynthesis protein ExoV [Sphingomonas xinjiangensis]